MMLRHRPVALLATLVIACVKAGDPNEDVADEGETETDSADGLDGNSAGSTNEAGDDADASDDESDGATSTDGTSGDGDCEIGEYVPDPIIPLIDWEQASGLVSHVATRGVFESVQQVDALFVTDTGVDDSKLCVEWLVGDGPNAIDECHVFYTQGFGLGGEWPDDGFSELAVDTATFDAGDGPIALEVWPGDQFNPTYYIGSLPPPPNGVPYGGTATFAATFDDLPALDLELDVPAALMPITPAHGSMALSSDELSSWTWSNPGGAEPVELVIDIGSTPWGTGWAERVQIRCDVVDDGEFGFPLEYLDLARERLGPEIHAGATITRRTLGQVPLAGASLYWTSINDVSLGVAIVD